MKKIVKRWTPSVVIVACAAVQIGFGIKEQSDQLFYGGIFVACFLLFTLPAAIIE